MSNLYFVLEVNIAYFAFFSVVLMSSTFLQHICLTICCHTSHSFKKMRRFSSEGSLQDLDTLQWDKLLQKKTERGSRRTSVVHTCHLEKDELDAGAAHLIPHIKEPNQVPSEVRKKELIKEQSVSVENLSELGKQDMDHLKVCVINEGCRAYSDSQLAPVAEDIMERGERDEHQMSPSGFSNPFSLKAPETQHQRAKFSAAKLHLKSLFGQVGFTLNSLSLKFLLNM